MKSRLTSREAVVLYLVVFTLFVGFFVLGLSLGRTPPPAGPPEAVERRPVREVPATIPPQRPPETVVETTLPPPPDPAAAREREPAEELVVVRETPVVEPAVSPPAAPPSPAVAPSAPPEGDRYTIQVAALSTLREAEQVLLRLEANDFRGRVQPPTAALGDRFHRVWVGEFRSIEEARDLEGRLKTAGFLTYVRRVE